MSVYLYMCVYWGGSETKGQKQKEKESDLLILSLSTLCFVLHLFTEFPHRLGGCSSFSHTGISIARLVVRSVWGFIQYESVPLLISVCSLEVR